MTMKASWGKIETSETRDTIRRAADQMGSFVRSTLGPLGQDKMILRRMDDDEIRAMVTNDGIAIIEEFEGETSHPVANMFIDLAEAQEADHGDGVTLAVLFASELIQEGMSLIETGVPAHDVIEGFSIGCQRTLERWEELAIPATTESGSLDRNMLRTVADTGMTNGRNGSWPLGTFADEVVEAVLRVSEPERNIVQLSHANTVISSGGDVSDAAVIDGAVIPEDPAGGEQHLPRSGTVLLLEGGLEKKQLKSDATISVTDTDTARTLRKREQSQRRRFSDRLAEANVAAVVAGGDVDYRTVEAIERSGAVCLRNIKSSRVQYLSKVTGATPISSFSLTSKIPTAKLGRTTVQYQPVKRDEEWISFTADEAETPQGVTILVHGGTERAAQEAERRIKHGKNTLRAVILRPEVLPAGGAPDIAAASAVRELAPRFDGREQLAVNGFANVLESIPRQLAKNAGIDPMDAVTTLRNRHEGGYERTGLTAMGKIVTDSGTTDGGLDPFLVRTTSLVRAVELVTQLFRIDGTLFNHNAAFELPD